MKEIIILGTLLCGMSLATHADSLRMSATEFAKDPAKVSALQKGLEKMRANNNANPLSPEFRTSFNYWANTHGYLALVQMEPISKLILISVCQIV